MGYFGKVANEQLVNIMYSLDTASITRLSVTCRGLLEVSHDESLWRNLYRTHFSSRKVTTLEGITWEQHYKAFGTVLFCTLLSAFIISIIIFWVHT